MNMTKHYTLSVNDMLDAISKVYKIPRSDMWKLTYGCQTIYLDEPGGHYEINIQGFTDYPKRKM